MAKKILIKAGVWFFVLIGFLSFPVAGSILDYVDNKFEIKNNLERFPSEVSESLLGKLGYIYDASIFRSQELIYNGLLKLYVDDRIGDRKLLDAWLHVELIDQFGAMDKSSTVDVLGSIAVDRIDLNKFPMWRESYLKKISGARGKVFAEALDDKIGKGPVYFSRVFLTDEEKKHLLSTRGSDVGPDYQNIFHLRQWIMRRTDMNPEFCCFIEEKGVILFASYSFFEDVLLSRNCHFIKPIPVLGTTTADHLFTLRGENKHPVVLFHPQVSNNFLYPHRRYAGVVACSLHDWFHIDILRCIPADHRLIYLNLDVMARSFKECLDNSLYCPDRFFPFDLMDGLGEVISGFKVSEEIKKSFQRRELSSLGMLHVSRVLLSGVINQEKVRSWLDQQFRLEYRYDPEEAMARVWLTQMKPLNFGFDDGVVDFLHEQYAIYWMCTNHPDDLKVLLSAIENNCDKIEDHKLFDDFGNKSINMRQKQIQERLCSTVEYMKFWMKKLDVPLKESAQSISHPFKSPHRGYHFPIVVP